MNTKQKNAISNISRMGILGICSVISFAKAFNLGDRVEKQLQQTLNKKTKEMEEYYNENSKND